MTDVDDYDAVSEVYGDYVSDPYPARSAAEVADIDVEIEVVAAV